MKKSITIFILTFILLFAFIFACWAQDNGDSLELSNEIKDKLKNDSTDIVIRYYNGFYMNAFAQKTSINDIVNGECVLQKLYMVITNDSEINYMYEKDGNTGSLLSKTTNWSSIYKNITEPKSIFRNINKNVKVNNIYCLDGNSSHDGIYIYYITNIGDYVYFKEYESSEKEYLFPIDDFYNFAKSVQEEREKNKYLIGGFVDIEKIYDVNKFEIRVSKTNLTPWFIAFCFIFATIVSTVVYVGIKKRRN